MKKIDEGGMKVEYDDSEFWREEVSAEIVRFVENMSSEGEIMDVTDEYKDKRNDFDEIVGWYSLLCDKFVDRREE